MTTVQTPVKGVGTRTGGQPGANLGFYVVAALGIALAAVIAFVPMNSLLLGCLVLVELLLVMAVGIPVGFAMIVVAVVGLFGMSGTRVLVSSVEGLTHSGIAQWSLSVLPMFILMGAFIGRGGLGDRAYDVALTWSNRVPGGLAVATNLAGGALASVSGSSMGITMTLGRIAIPQMLRNGYSPSLATGSVAMAGTLGQVIPPSILLVIYAGVAAIPVGPALLAGIAPGAMLLVAFIATILLIATIRPKLAPRADVGSTWGDKLRSLPNIVPIVILLLVVMGGIFSGFFTSTEAAAAGAVVAAVIVIVMILARPDRSARKVGRFLRESVMEAAVSVASIFVIIVGSLLLGRVIVLTGLGTTISNGIIDLNLDRWSLLLLLILFYLVLGMFLESLPMILLTVPILQAPLEAVGIDPIWFGAFLIVMCEIGMVFPPIGLLTFVVHRIAQNKEVNLGQKVSLGDVFKGVMPFVVAAFVVLMIMIAWPEIVLFLPYAGNAAT